MIQIGSLTFTPEAVAKLGLEEQSPFEQPSIKEGTQVAGSGVSVQTERGLLESGVHPDEEMQKAWDERKQKKTTEPTYKDTGETQMQTYERVMGKEAVTERKLKQQKEFERLMKERERGLAPYGYRPDGSPKGEGWLGKLPIPETSDIATEYSVGVEINGKEIDIPTLVPTLTKQEVTEVLNAAKEGRFPSEAVMKKAVEHAQKRLQEGQSPFKD